MPLALIVIGIAMVIAGARKQAGNLGAQVATDFSGGFLVWVGAIVGIGMLGNVPMLQKPSRLLLMLVILVFVLRNGGLFQLGAAAFEKAPKSDGTNTVTYTPSAASSSGGGSGGLLGPLVGAASSLFGI
jgi:hypothetical protein